MTPASVTGRPQVFGVTIDTCARPRWPAKNLVVLTDITPIILDNLFRDLRAQSKPPGIVIQPTERHLPYAKARYQHKENESLFWLDGKIR